MHALITAIRESWGWCGIDPIEVIETNPFGNLLILDAEGAIWKLCPEEAYCEQIASSREELDALSRKEDFQLDWQMEKLVQLAKSTVGDLAQEYSYCLKTPGLLGGEYGGSNLASVPTVELISFSGTIAERIRDLPDGAEVRIEVGD